MNASPLHIELIERGIRLKSRVTGTGRHPDPWRHFGPGGLALAEVRCAAANRDLLGFVRPPARPPTGGLAGRLIRIDSSIELHEFRFDSPRPSGDPFNDRVELRVYLPRGAHQRRVVLFHHPIYQRRWSVWEWFLTGLLGRVPVAMMAQPYHFDRTPPGEFPGEGTCNPNPWRLFQALRQWSWDQQAATRVLQTEMNLAPAAAIGFSIGAFHTLLAAAGGTIDLPLVSIASTNRYAWAVSHGVTARGLREGLLRVGIDEHRLRRMTESVQLERYVPSVRSPVLYIDGRHDLVDPPPSLDRLRRALSPARALRLPAGHGTLLLYRRRIIREILDFFSSFGLA